MIFGTVIFWHITWVIFWHITWTIDTQYNNDINVVLSFGRVICLSDLGNIWAYYLDKTTLLYKYHQRNSVCEIFSFSSENKCLYLHQCQRRWISEIYNRIRGKEWNVLCNKHDNHLNTRNYTRCRNISTRWYISNGHLSVTKCKLNNNMVIIWKNIQMKIYYHPFLSLYLLSLYCFN